MLYAYAREVQEEALEDYRWAELYHRFACMAPRGKGSPKLVPPKRPAILDWDL